MEFDRNVALLQGALLVRANGVVPGVERIFQGVEYNESFKLFACLMINAEFFEPNTLSAQQKSALAPVANLSRQRLSITEFFSIFDASPIEMWPRFCLARLFLPSSSVFLSNDVILDKMFSLSVADHFMSTLTYVSTTFMRAKLSEGGSEDDLHNIVTRCIEHLSNSASFGQQFLSILYLSKVASSNDVNSLMSMISLTSSELKSCFGFDVRGASLHEGASDVIVDVLVQHVLHLVKNISVDVWIDLVDESTEQIFRNQVLNFWTRDKYPPSNFQLLIGHYAHEMVPFLESSQKIELANILKNFAKNYDRKMELRLSELTPDELMTAARTEVAKSDGGWRQEAYVQHLASLDESTLMSKDVLMFLQSHSKYLIAFAEKFYNLVMQYNTDVSVGATIKECLKKLLESVVHRLSLNDARQLLNIRLSGLDLQLPATAEFNLALKLKTFDENCRVIMNRMTEDNLTDTENLVKVIWHMIQSPFEFIHFLLNESCDNAGKIPVVVAIVDNLFTDLSKEVMFIRPLLLGPLVDRIGQPESSKASKNGSILLQSLASRWCSVNQFDLIECSIELVLGRLRAVTPKSDVTQLSPLIDMIQKLLPCHNKLNSDLKQELIQEFGEWLVTFYHKLPWSNMNCCLLEQIMQVAQTLTETEESNPIISQLGPGLQDYFRSMPEGTTIISCRELVRVVRRSSRTGTDFGVIIHDESDRVKLILEIVSALPRFLSQDLKYLVEHVQVVQVTDVDKETFKPIFSEVLIAANLFFATQPSISNDHLEYISSNLGQALASAVENLSLSEIEAECWAEWQQLYCRLLLSAEKVAPNLIDSMQMCLVNIVGQILQQDQDEVSFRPLAASLLLLPHCDAKTLCLTKISRLNENNISEIL